MRGISLFVEFWNVIIHFTFAWEEHYEMQKFLKYKDFRETLQTRKTKK